MTDQDRAALGAGDGLALIDFVSQGDPQHATGLMGLPQAKLPAGAVVTDGDTQIAAALPLLKQQYAATGDWGKAFQAYLAAIGVPESPTALQTFNERRRDYGAA